MVTAAPPRRGPGRPPKPRLRARHTRSERVLVDPHKNPEPLIAEGARLIANYHAKQREMEIAFAEMCAGLYGIRKRGAAGGALSERSGVSEASISRWVRDGIDQLGGGLPVPVVKAGISADASPYLKGPRAG